MTFYPKRSGFMVWGPVWAIGSKLGEDKFGRYMGFVVAAPALYEPAAYHRLRVYVRWYDWQFVPEPRQMLECMGTIGHVDVEPATLKADRLRVVLRCWGDWIKAGAEKPHIAGAAEKKWRELLEAGEEVREG